MKAKAYRELPTHWCWRDARKGAGRENGIKKTGKGIIKRVGTSQNGHWEILMIQ